MSSLKCSTDCALTKCSGNLFHNFTVEGKKECKYELILADGILNLCTCPLVEVHSGIMKLLVEQGRRNVRKTPRQDLDDLFNCP